MISCIPIFFTKETSVKEMIQTCMKLLVQKKIEDIKTINKTNMPDQDRIPCSLFFLEHILQSQMFDTVLTCLTLIKAQDIQSPAIQILEEILSYDQRRIFEASRRNDEEGNRHTRH